MKALFERNNGRLKTSRVAFFVFLALLVCLSFAYKIGKSADKVLVKIEHVFEAQKKENKPKDQVVDVNKPMEYPVPEEKFEIKPEQTPDTGPEKKSILIKPAKPVEKKIEKPEELQLVKKSKANPELEAKNTPVGNQTVKKTQKDKIKTPEKDQIRFTLAQDLKLKPDLNKESMKTKNENLKTLKLSSKEYFEVYKQWQEQGETLDREKVLVNLRILNLENVYDLFQMKAVVIKEGVPHTDLEDNSRIAKASLSEFSSTCFIVSDPWRKWGQALKDAGFNKNDNIEVWYYTYEFVRNSIYARALKAFEWSIEKQNLPKDTDPSKADVLGMVYAVNKDGGGAFGVFVPLQVDFQSYESVKINSLLCFNGQKDIQALNNAGLL